MWNFLTQLEHTTIDADVRFFQLNSKPGGTILPVNGLYMISNRPKFLGTECVPEVNFSTDRPAIALGSMSSRDPDSKLKESRSTSSWKA